MAGFIRTPFFVQQNKRRYYPQTDPVPNLLIGPFSKLVFVKPFVPVETYIPGVRARIAHMPVLVRPEVTPTAPTSPLPFRQQDWDRTYVRDRMSGQEFESEAFLVTSIVGSPFSPKDFPNPIQKKSFQSDQVPNTLLNVQALLHQTPFHQNDWYNTNKARQLGAYDFSPNLILGTFVSVTSPPFVQTDWVVPRRAMKKWLADIDYINSQIPNFRPGPSSVTAVGGGRILGLFSSGRILGIFS